MGIISLIYDLIPLTIRNSAMPDWSKVFNHWFDWIAATADAVAISGPSRRSARGMLRASARRSCNAGFDYFHLGSGWTWWKLASSVDAAHVRRPGARYS